ncbi:thymidylate synthase (plasmid) [Rossellomorea sp. AcN35-11]|nr:thymidylate synthase [Rossellomorea aquimaris]WJV32227.1 thymidylate synthase [Rossellomorea sp. AcN35-11]
MNNVDMQVQELGRYILENGVVKDDRTGVGTLSISGYQMKFDLSEGFPLLTVKLVPFKLVKSEKLWFIKGDSNIRFLLENDNSIWNEWAFEKWVKSEEYNGPDMTDFGIRSQNDPDFNEIYQEEMHDFKKRVLEDDDFAAKYGDLGRVYGKQWREAFYVNPDTMEVETVDQLKDAIKEIKNNPSSRRIIVNSWNPDNYKGHAGLPACHHNFQFLVREDKLDLILDLRSNDYFLGLSFNLSGYALLCHLVAQETGYKPGELIYHGKDIHIYLNHIEQVKEMLSREPKELPKLVLNPDISSVFDFAMEDIKVEDYNPHPTIKAPVAV